MSITLIACLDMASGLSDANGNLLFNIPKDMKHFKAVTNNKTVVMGRKTWDSLPKKPLANRKNYVLSSDKTFNPEGAIVIDSIDKVLELSKGREIYVIGGGNVYNQTLPHADKLIITFVHEFNFDARVFFPDFSPKDWKSESIQKHEEDKKNGQPSFTFATYSKR